MKRIDRINLILLFAILYFYQGNKWLFCCHSFVTRKVVCTHCHTKSSIHSFATRKVYTLIYSLKNVQTHFTHKNSIH